MPVDSVFVSSVMTGFVDVREKVASALTRIDVHSVLAERHAADPQASREAMFEAIERSDFFLLLMGSRYGEPDETGKSPTEQEFDHADSLNRPALVLVQKDAQMESEQEAFLERVRGTWSEGVFYDQFIGAEDVGEAVLAAMNAQSRGGLDNVPAAEESVTRMLTESDRNGSGGIVVRVAFVPVRELTLLDAVKLENEELPGRLMQEVRDVGLVTPEMGLRKRVSAAEGIVIEGTDQETWTVPRFAFGPDGSVVVSSSIRASNDFVQAIDPGLLRQRVRSSGDLAIRAWKRMDDRRQITRVATGAAIQEAQYKVFGEPSGNSINISSSLPSTVTVPNLPALVSVGSIASEEHANRIVSEFRRVFVDAGALE